MGEIQSLGQRAPSKRASISVLRDRNSSIGLEKAPISNHSSKPSHPKSLNEQISKCNFMESTGGSFRIRIISPTIRLELKVRSQSSNKKFKWMPSKTWWQKPKGSKKVHQTPPNTSICSLFLAKNPVITNQKTLPNSSWEF